MANRLPTLSRRRLTCAQRGARQIKGSATLREKDRERGNSGARGYDRRWRKSRALWLAQNPLCVECEKHGNYTPATLVDHIQPVQSAFDPRFYDTDNFQSLCRSCHQQKTFSDRAAGLTRKPAVKRVTKKPLHR